MKMASLKPICFLPLLLISCEREKSSKIDSSEINSHATVTPSPQVTDSKLDNVSIPPSNADGKRIQKRGLKQKYPELVKLPKQPNPTVERLNREIKGINGNDPAFAKKLTQLWSESVTQLPATPLPSAEDAEVAKGLLLPKEILPALKVTAERNDDGSAEAMLFVVGSWSAMICSDTLTKFAMQHANALPPTVGDIVIYQALNSGIREFTQTRGKSSYASFEPWESFANSANPIYRLLALQAAPVSVSKPAWNIDIDSKEFNRINEEPKMSFYLSYLDEKDPVILTEVIRVLSHVPLPEARQAIEKFHAQQLQKGDTVLIQAAEEALRTQKLVSP